MPKEQQHTLIQSLGKSLSEQAIAIRDRRRVIEQRWLQNRRMWMKTELESRYTPSESSSGSYNLPAGRRAIERSVVRVVKILTPSVKWFETAPVSILAEQNASNVDQFMWYVLRKRIRSRTNISQLARSMILYGLAHIKTSPIIVNGQVWPIQRVLDPFAHYAFPETAASQDEIEVQFDDYLFSYEKYRTFVQKGLVEDISPRDLTKPDWPYHLVERLAYQGITDPTANVELTIEEIGDKLLKTSGSFCSMSEMWIRREDKLYQVFHLWNYRNGPRCVGFIESDYDEPLIRTVIHRSLPGERYTNDMASDIAELDILQNDQLNKFQEAVDWEQGFIAENEQMVGRSDGKKAKGRAIWKYQDDPRMAMQFIQPPVTSTNQLRAWQIYLSLINSMAGAGTIAEGQPGRNMPRAGFAMNALLDMSMADIADVADLLETECLTLSLSDIYKVSAKFIPQDQLIRIPGGEGISSAGRKMQAILTKRDILGDYEFDWIGSLQSQDNQMRSQRSMIFFQLLANPAVTQQLQQQGYVPNFVELVRTIWRDTLGERGLADIIVPLSEMQKIILQGQLDNSEENKGSNPLQIGNNGANGNSQPVPGLSYNLPSVTNGFVQQQ